MRNRLIFALSVIGIMFGLISAYYFGTKPKAQPPVFTPASNPYEKGIYANGIVESYQANGQNINIYQEVSGTVVQLLAKEGEQVHAGTPLLMIDDAVQRATVGQQKSQAEAASTTLQALKAQPRKENLAVAKAQMELAAANLKASQDQYDKQQRSYDIEPRSVSKEAFDNAHNALNTAHANLELAHRQYELIRAGAWSYDINNAQRQVEALSKAYEGSSALLEKYTVRAPIDGVVLSINTAVGSYVSPQGIYSTYTQGAIPAITMGGNQDYFNVRCYIDEILISRLPPADKITAQMSIRGTDTRIPLEFVRVQPYVSPKIALSDQRQERVDLRVLPIIFRFARKDGITIYPGQLVDVYIGQKSPS
jgi:HlyD family secretion protein